MTQDLTMMHTRDLPPGCEHVELPVTRYGELRRLERTGAVTVVGSRIQVGGTIYTTVRRNTHRAPAPAWLRPVGIVAGLALTGAGILAAVSYAVRTMTAAVTQAGPALGFLVALSVVLLVVAAIRRRSGHTVEVVTRTRVRAK